METLKTQNILPNINGEDLTRSHTQIFKQTIDNPRDNDLKRRQTLWSFQHKNRGVRGKFKEMEGISPFLCDESFDETGVSTDDAKGKNGKRLTFLPKLKQKLKSDPNMSSPVDEPHTVKREYSSALRIGNSLYEQLGIKQNSDTKSNLPKQRSLLKSMEKCPEVSSSLSKLGYLKAGKNAVHYGGGFFGRNGNNDRKYSDLRRSWTVLSPTETKSINNEIQVEHKPHHGSLKQLNAEETKMVKNVPSENKETKQTNVLKISSSDIKERYPDTKEVLEQQRQKRKIEKDSDDGSKRSKEDMIAMEMLSEKYSINFDKSFDKSSIDEVPDEKVDDASISEECTRRNEEWQKQIDIIVAKHERELVKKEHERIDKKNNIIRNQKRKELKTKGSQTSKSNYAHGRPKSDTSLDIPVEQFGPSSYRPDEVTNRLLNAAYCINPYRWTSRSSLTEGDRSWVEKAMEKTEIIDTTIYDVFARKKQKSVVKNSEHTGKEKSTVSSKPP